MSYESDKLANLLDYVQAERRVCPNPDQWNDLWNLLPDKERVGTGWNPALPLILGAWWHTSVLEKQLRLREHIEYGAKREVLDSIDSFLRGLAPDQWFTRGDA